jgi:hypothetical protein
MDFNINNYTLNELLEIIEIPKKEHYTTDDIETYVTTCINQSQYTDSTETTKENINQFLINVFKKLCDSLELSYTNVQINNLQSVSTTPSILPQLESVQTFNENGKSLIVQSNNSDSTQTFSHSYRTGVINPLKKQYNRILFNLNTRFRDNYFNTKNTDFIYNLPNPIKNVVSMELVSAEIPTCIYTFSSKTKTNEFTIQLYDVSGGTEFLNETEKIIKIRNGQYTGEQLEDYLNKFVFTLDNSLNRVACEYHKMTCKFRFFYDRRDISNGGAGGFGDGGIEQRFNLDFRLHDTPTSPIQLNMGWLLGYKQPYYDWTNNYVLPEIASYDRFEGYNPEGIYDGQGSRYLLLSVDDYNNNYTNTIQSPFQEGMMINQGLLAKIPTIAPSHTIVYKANTGYINPIRQYFGPVNIDKLHIQLLDELGRPVDLNNADYSIAIDMETLYDL